MTQKQERERARRRYAKQQAMLAAKEAERARTKRVAIVVVTLLVVVVGFVFLTAKLQHKSTAAAKTAAGCPIPPASLGTGADLTMPSDKAVVGKTFTAVITTNCGDVTLQLDGTKAPEAVASFQQLAQKNYWLNAPCHRLTTAGSFILQCGDPTGTGQGTPGYGFGVENAPTDNIYPRGTVAMARTADPKKGNGGQFFLVYKDTTLPGAYTIFGKVTGGMDIVDKVAAAGTADGSSDGPPKASISILRVAVTEKKA